MLRWHYTMWRFRVTPTHTFSLSMGNSASRNGASKSKEIDIALENDRIKQSMNYKVLILGSGGSGKSTIMKQMKLIYGEGFENSLARQIYKKQIVCNILESMQAILGVMSNFSDDYKYQTTEEHIKGRLRSFHDEQDAQELIATIQELWKDPKIQQAYGQCKNRLHESTE
jgi:energy-coupling factor transporter ATP-binding protein EcfA2